MSEPEGPGPGADDPDDRGAVEGLHARIRELEAARALDLERLSRAEAALANTQFELLAAQRRAADAEARLTAASERDLEPARGAGEGVRLTPPGRSEVMPPRATDPDPLVETLRTHISFVREQLGAVGTLGREPDAAAEREEREDRETVADADQAREDGGSLRERLAQAANSRHRHTPRR